MFQNKPLQNNICTNNNNKIEFILIQHSVMVGLLQCNFINWSMIKDHLLFIFNIIRMLLVVKI